jgi:uncharacterized protein (TIRG00374 family)
MKRRSVILQLIVSIIAIAVVVYLSDFGKVAGILWRLNLLYLVIAAFFYILINILMGFRITMVLNDLKERLGLIEATEASFSGMLASDFTPGRVGYFATAFVITANSRIALHKSMLSIFGPQLFDFSFKLITGAIALWYLIEFISSESGGQGNFVGMFIGIAIFVSMIVFMSLLLFSKSFVRRLAFIKIFPYGKYTHELLSNMQKNSKTMRKFALHFTILFVIGWTLKAFEWLFVAKSVGLELNSQIPLLIFFAFLFPLVTILQFIPSPTLAGMGLSEGGTAVILSLFGVPAYESVAFALLARTMNIAVDLVGVKGAVKVLNRI